jgi:hypothetical protein
VEVLSTSPFLIDDFGKMGSTQPKISFYADETSIGAVIAQKGMY